MSTFGKNYRVTTFGESHCDSVGVIIDGVIPQFKLSLDKIQQQLNRRRPGQSSITTPRNEADKLVLLSGMEKGLTLGTPLAFLVKNRDTRPQDYKFSTEYLPRPSHADLTYLWKYGIHASSGGGRSSARETIGRVIAGAVAEQILENFGIKIVAWTNQIGKIKLNLSEEEKRNMSREKVDQYITRCPNQEISDKMTNLILNLKQKGDSVGGIVTCYVTGVPRGLGEPVFDKMEAKLAHAMLSIPATKGFEIGSGFDCVTMSGSQHNDSWIYQENNITTSKNDSGGIIGGISSGEDIYFNVCFKPASTINKKQQTINLNGEDKELKAKGRHDPCVVPRAISIVESMTSCVLLDMLLIQQSRKATLAGINPNIGSYPL